MERFPNGEDPYPWPTYDPIIILASMTHFDNWETTNQAIARNRQAPQVILSGSFDRSIVMVIKILPALLFFFFFFFYGYTIIILYRLVIKPGLFK